jgi:hypothetical protein
MDKFYVIKRHDQTATIAAESLRAAWMRLLSGQVFANVTAERVFELSVMMARAEMVKLHRGDSLPVLLSGQRYKGLLAVLLGLPVEKDVMASTKSGEILEELSKLSHDDFFYAVGALSQGLKSYPIVEEIISS